VTDTILVMGPSESVVRAAVNAVASAPGVPRGARVKGVLADGPSVKIVETVAGGATSTMGAWEPPKLSGGPRGSLFDGDPWGPVGGDDWGDTSGFQAPPVEPPARVPTPTPAAVDLEFLPPLPETASAFPEEPTPRPRRAKGPTDMSGVPPAIVDAARTLRRFVDGDVPKGVLLRVIRARVKTAGNVQTGLKDLCTLVKEYGADQSPVMDAYRMVDHALPRVREKQALKVLSAIFGVE